MSCWVRLRRLEEGRSCVSVQIWMKLFYFIYLKILSYLLFVFFVFFNCFYYFICVLYFNCVYFGSVLFSTISCPLPAGGGGCVTRCNASFLCLASGLAGWLATAGQGSRRGISHGYAATMFFGGSECFRASWVVEIPPAPWGRRERAAAGGGPRVGG